MNQSKISFMNAALLIYASAFSFNGKQSVARYDSPADERPMKNGHAESIVSSMSASPMFATVRSSQFLSAVYNSREKKASPEKSVSDQASEPDNGSATLRQRSGSSYCESPEAMRGSHSSKGLGTSATVSAQDASPLYSDRMARAVKIITALKAPSSFTNSQNVLLIFFCDIYEFDSVVAVKARLQAKPNLLSTLMGILHSVSPPPSDVSHPLPVSSAISARTFTDLLPDLSSLLVKRRSSGIRYVCKMQESKFSTCCLTNLMLVLCLLAVACLYCSNFLWGFGKGCMHLPCPLDSCAFDITSKLDTDILAELLLFLPMPDNQEVPL